MGFDASGMKALGKMFKKQYGLTGRRVTVDTKATVYGTRDTVSGNWSLFVQIKACYFYEKKHENGSWIAEGGFWAPISCAKFFPGTGVSMIRQNLSYIL